MKNRLFFSALLLLQSMVLGTCKKESDKVAPTVTTTAITTITQTTASAGGVVTDQGSASVIVRGVCWGTLQNPTTDNSLTNNGSGTGSFTTNIAGLTPNTTYYVRAYATNSVGTAYGSQVSITTLAPVAYPTVTSASITNIAQTTATGGGNVTSDGGGTVTARGICYSTNQNPTTNNQTVLSGSGTGSFTTNITGLTPNTTYYVRAYATNSAGTDYGGQENFKTLTQIVAPTVSTEIITNITQTTATGGGNVTSDGGATVTVRGICYSTSTNPTTNNQTVLSGNGTGSFTTNITGLTLATTYYVRAYATNNAGTDYGIQESFTTLGPQVVVPSVSTAIITGITHTTATGGGNVTSDGGATVTVRGICYSTSTNPTTNNQTVLSGNGTGSFTANMTGLTPNTTYYVRIYAINSAGTGYGSQVSFTTLTQVFIPIITTSSITNITQTTAAGGGNVTSDGGGTVIARGLCYSTNQDPTTSNQIIPSGNGIGTFTANIFGLTQSTAYYVRAYATNSAGTGYGDQESFTTLTCPATVKDIDSNVYNTVLIGIQCWMAGNLKTTKYRSGTEITYPGSDTAWSSNTAGAYTWYNNDILWKDNYGALYNRYAAVNYNGLCPAGWHVPSDDEWTQLVNYLVAQGFPNSNVTNGAGNVLKSCRQINSPHGGACATSVHPRWWESPSASIYGTDNFGFSALPGGIRDFDGTFKQFGYTGIWWSSTERSSPNALGRSMVYNFGNVFRIAPSKALGVSVRCLRD